MPCPARACSAGWSATVVHHVQIPERKRWNQSAHLRLLAALGFLCFPIAHPSTSSTLFLDTRAQLATALSTRRALGVISGEWCYVLVQFQSFFAKEAKPLLDAGEYVMVDVRPAEDFEKATVEGAKNVPLFQRISFSNPSPGKLLRGLAYALNGVQAVEVNPDFEEQMKAAGGGKKVMLVRACWNHTWVHGEV